MHKVGIRTIAVAGLLIYGSGIIRPEYSGADAPRRGRHHAKRTATLSILKHRLKLGMTMAEVKRLASDLIFAPGSTGETHTVIEGMTAETDTLRCSDGVFYVCYSYYRHDSRPQTVVVEAMMCPHYVRGDGQYLP